MKPDLSAAKLGIFLLLRALTNEYRGQRNSAFGVILLETIALLVNTNFTFVNLSITVSCAVKSENSYIGRSEITLMQRGFTKIC